MATLCLILRLCLRLNLPSCWQLAQTVQERDEDKDEG